MEGQVLDPYPLAGELSSAPIIPANNYSTRLENARIIKTGAGILYGFTVTNTNASAQFVLVFDSRTVPADTAVPIIAISVPGGNGTGFNWIPGRSFLYGIVLCNSSTQATKTIGAADCLFDAQFM